MYVVKRDGQKQDVSPPFVLDTSALCVSPSFSGRSGPFQEVKFDSITKRIRNLCQGLDPKYIDPVPVTQKVVEGFYNGISTAEVDTLAAETCAYMSQKHPDFSTLAARIAVSNLHKRLDRALHWSEAHLGVARKGRCLRCPGELQGARCAWDLP